LVQGEWEVAELGAIVRTQLEPYLAEKSPRVKVKGPDVSLSANIATPFALLIHELATNAVKYGALSAPRGEVSLIWQLIEASRERRLRLVWTETGGPPVKPPLKTGFGSYLIGSGLAQAQVERDFRREGLVCTVALSLPEQDAGKG